MGSPEFVQDEEQPSFSPDFSRCAGRPDVYKVFQQMRQAGTTLRGSQQEYPADVLERLFESGLNEIRSSGIHEMNDPRIDSILSKIGITSTGGFREAVKRISFADVEESWQQRLQ